MTSMMRPTRRDRILRRSAHRVMCCFVFCVYFGLVSCAHHPMREDQLRSIEQLTDAWESQSDIHQDLSNLPPPAGLVAASVFSFRDQSGQYKPAPSNAFSTAVSQGGTAMVVEALADSGWFLALEREGLQNLLTERKIIRARRGDSAVPPLQGANIIIEGGVIGYDSNIKTGGAGAKYLGIGADEKYRVDALTVNLRAIDTANGTVIHTVNVTKTIISHAITASVFRFVKFKRLLEAEAGVTQNEPTQLILKDAIDTAVIRLILLGLVEGSWQLKDYRDLKDERLFLYATPMMQKQLIALHDRVARQTSWPPAVPMATSDVAPGGVRHAPKSGTGLIKKRDARPGAQKPNQANARANHSSANPTHSAQPKKGSSRAPTTPALQAAPKNSGNVVSKAHAENRLNTRATPTRGSADHDFSIQLAASHQVEGLRELSAQWGLPRDLVRIIRVKDVGSGDQKEWYTLQLGSYRSSEEAQTALEALPASLRTFEPWVNQRAQQFAPLGTGTGTGAAGVSDGTNPAPVGSAQNPLKVQ